MSWPFIYIVEQAEPGFVLRQVMDTLGGFGVSLRHKANGRITMLTNEGEQREVTETEISVHALPKTVQFWVAVDVDLVCSFARIKDESVRHTYSLKGLNAYERDKANRWAVDYFRSAAHRGTAVWLVIDPVGVSADTDWDSVVLGESELPKDLPRVLGARSERIDEFRIPADYQKIPLENGLTMVADPLMSLRTG